MRDGAEEFWGMAFFLEWVVCGGFADELDGGGVDFPLLAFSRRFDEFTGDSDGCAGGYFGDVCVAWDAVVCDALDIGE